MLLWKDLNPEQKFELVTHLHNKRALLVWRSKRERTSSNRKKAKKVNFKSKELEQLFNALPPEMRKSMKL